MTSLLLPVLQDKKSSPEVVALAALACGLITVGAADPDVLPILIQALQDLPVSELQEGQYSRFLPLAIGLCYLGSCFNCVAACLYINYYRGIWLIKISVNHKT